MAMNPSPVTFVDLCSGAGGFSAGFLKAGWTPLLGVDVCAKSLRTYQANIGSATLCLDLLSKDAKQQIKAKLQNIVPTAVIAGPPCQGFSRAGRRDPADPRNQVFVECARHAVALGAGLIVFENVPYIAEEPFRKFLDSAGRILARNGYCFERAEVEAGNFGVPQRRKRLLLIGFRKENAENVHLAIEQISAVTGPIPTVRDAWAGLPTNCRKAIELGISNHVAMKHSKAVREKIRRIPIGTGPLSYRKLHPSRPALTLIAGHSAMPCHYSADRTITVREAARIQGFDDSFIFVGGIRSEMNQVANAVPPKLSWHIGKTFLPFFALLSSRQQIR
jgi:DNA (cytosine-5)-methyltransferase 1